MNGWLILDKPQGMTSTRAGAIVKKLGKIQKLGHMGTLDPMATGVLVLALNEATKLIPYVENHKSIFEDQNAEKLCKEYEFDICFGFETDTYDADGKIVNSCDYTPTLEEILAICPKMLGAYDQIPPLYSAIKVQGRRLCDLAREGKVIERKKRPVFIYSLELVSFKDASCVRFRAKVSPGTYIRSLAYDLAMRLGSLGYVTYLRRIKDGNFKIKNAISLEKLEKLLHKGGIEEVIVPIGAVLGDIPAVSVSEQERENINFGRSFLVKGSYAGSVVKLIYAKELIGMGKIENGICFPKKVLKK